jgi:hypothetical protein
MASLTLADIARRTVPGGDRVAKHWIKAAIKNPGGLHRALGVPQGQKIPADKLAKAKRSENPRVKRMANIATTLEGMHHRHSNPRGERWYGKG